MKFLVLFIALASFSGCASQQNRSAHAAAVSERSPADADSPNLYIRLRSQYIPDFGRLLVRPIGENKFTVMIDRAKCDAQKGNGFDGLSCDLTNNVETVTAIGFEFTRRPASVVLANEKIPCENPNEGCSLSAKLGVILENDEKGQPVFRVFRDGLGTRVPGRAEALVLTPSRE